jgi:hypothetical protein
LWIKKNLKRMRDLRVLRVGVSFAPLIREPLHKPNQSHARCHPEGAAYSPRTEGPRFSIHLDEAKKKGVILRGVYPESPEHPELVEGRKAQDDKFAKLMGYAKVSLTRGAATTWRGGSGKERCNCSF